MREFSNTSPLESFLDSDEKLLWSGQPKKGLRLQASDIVMIPFSLMWGGFAIFWEATALGIVGSHSFKQHPGGAGPVVWVFPLFGIPFVLAGLYMIFGRFFYDAAVRSKTYYGVTNKRLMIMKSLFAGNVTSYDYETLTNLNFVERRDHSGDITFGSPNFMPNFPGSRANRSYTPPGFYLLPNVREVYNQIRTAQQAKG